MKTHTLSLTVVTDKEIPDMTDIFAGRIYTIDGVTDCTVSAEVPKEVSNFSIDAQITAFNKMYNLRCEDVPKVYASRPETTKRIRDFMTILKQEVQEGEDILAAIDHGNEPNYILTLLADWLCDIQIYCMSEMKKYGLPNNLMIGIIMASNMSKLGADGQPIIDATGKVLKGPNYWAPEDQIRRAIEALQRESMTRGQS
jgi:predicted HAD superfamily Cof-like phosphohydrolase